MIFKSKPNNNKKLLLFIGSPRTGSTLLGQIINYHPNCLIANEFRLLNKIIVEKKNINKNFTKLEKYALNQFRKGLENDKKYGKTLHKYQQKWTEFKKFTTEPEFKKQEIKLIGDKKAGGNIQVIKKYPDDANAFFKQINELFFLQIIRHPVIAALSLMKSHNFDNFEVAIHFIISQTTQATSFIESNFNYKYIYYEDLQKNPENEIKKIFNFLDIETNIVWLKKISAIVSKPKEEIINKEHINIFHSIIDKYQHNNVLKRYLK